MQDILKYSVDKLFQNVISSMEDLDVDAVRGSAKTVSGIWMI